MVVIHVLILTTLQENFLSQGTHSKVCPPCLFFMCVVICFFCRNIKLKNYQYLSKLKKELSSPAWARPCKLCRKLSHQHWGASAHRLLQFSPQSSPPRRFNWNVYLGCSPPPGCPRSSRPSRPRQVRRGRGHPPPPPQSHPPSLAPPLQHSYSFLS